MTRVLILGATGRAGLATLALLPPGTEIIAALRSPVDATRLPEVRNPVTCVVVDIFDAASLRAATTGVDVIVNAIRLREDIAPTELVDLHQRITDAAHAHEDPTPIVTVGGAGSLHLGDGQRFWRDPAFPPVTQPRGHGHAWLRDYLESGAAGGHWAYLVPPPMFTPDGPRTGTYAVLLPTRDERHLLDRSISYADFALAVTDAVTRRWTGTHLIATPRFT